MDGLANRLLRQTKQGGTDAVAELVPAAARRDQAVQEPAEGDGLLGVAVPLRRLGMAALRFQQDGGEQAMRRVSRRAETGIGRPQWGEVESGQGTVDPSRQVIDL
jgi:hypothetical protein